MRPLLSQFTSLRRNLTLPGLAALGVVVLCAWISPCLADNLPPAPAIAARSWLLYDTQSGQILEQHSPDLRVEPASLTKLMTAYLVFEALRQKRLTLEQTLPVSVKAWQAEGSRMFIEPNRPVSVDELLRGMIVQSGNDATIALAEGVGGSEEGFVQMMNREAVRMGLKSTHFVTATGLPDPQHYTTATDLNRLAAYLIRDFPEYFPLYSLRDYTYNRITQRNRNNLLGRDPYVDGLKTGHTEAAGYCLIATAKREQRRLIAIVLGADSESARVTEAQKLLNHGFQNYEVVRLYARGAPVAQLPVWKGSEDVLKAGFERDLFVSVPRGLSDKLKARLESQQPLIAPVSRSQRVGTLKLSFGEQPFGEFPVLALEGVDVANVFGRAWDSMRLLFK